jgi:hypothetical protein
MDVLDALELPTFIYLISHHPTPTLIEIQTPARFDFRFNEPTDGGHAVSI